MKKFKGNKKLIALVLLLSITCSISAYGVTGELYPEKNGLLSVWNLSLYETYRGNNMYSYDANEKQKESRSFDEVSLYIVAFGMYGNVTNTIIDYDVFELTGNVTADPSKQAIGTGACDYYVFDTLYGSDTKRLTHN